MKNNFEIVIVGTDMNAYYMARCCHEAYNKKAYVIGKGETTFISHSTLFHLTLNKDLKNPKVFKKVLEEKAKELDYKNKKLVLIGTSDATVRLIVENSKFLKKYYIFNTIDENLLNNLILKEQFYTKYQDYDINIPRTYIYNYKSGKIPSDFSYPLILKSSDSVEYFNNEFENMSKVYKLYNEQELKKAIDDIEKSGYKSNLIIQEFIPGDDSALFDSVFYVNTKGKAEFASFAQIALQEHMKTAIGNCTVLVNGYNEHGIDENIVMKLKNFLEKIGYKGLAEVDLKYDYRDKKYKVLEINARQGRSSYYLCAMGYNPVEYLVDDLIYGKEHKFIFIKDKILLTMVPKIVIKKYVTNNKLKKEILKLYKQGKVADPMRYKKDLNLKRRIHLFMRKINYIKKYMEYKW